MAAKKKDTTDILKEIKEYVGEGGLVAAADGRQLKPSFRNRHVVRIRDDADDGG